jgi:hypothetical protein
MTNTRATIFISYAHRDKRHLDRLLVHLEPLCRRGKKIESWSDRRIAPGRTWEREIAGAMSSAKVAILLISADFLASDFIVTHELPELLRLARRSAITVLPVVLGHCSFRNDRELASFQAVNDPARPVDALPIAERERVWNRVLEAVEASLAGRPADEGWRVVNERIVFDSLTVLSTWRRSNGFVIFQIGDFYVQLMRDLDTPTFHCEAVSSEYLPAAARLSRSRVQKLRAIGFTLQRGRESNFTQTFRHDRKPAKIRAIAKIVVRIFSTIYQSSKNENIAVSGGIVKRRNVR